MPRLSIDYLNARRESKPAAGGKRYEVKRNAVDDRAQFAQIDKWELALLEAQAIIDDFSSWARSTRLEPEQIMRGESFDDLAF